MKFTNKVLMIGVTCLLAAGPLLAQDTVASVAENFTGYMGSFASLLMSVMFLVGLGLGGMAALKLKSHNDDPRQVKITVPIIYALCSAVLIALPGWLTLTSASVTDGQSNDITGEGYRQM